MMKTNLISGLMMALLFLAGSTTVYAQDEGINVIPVELFTCSYQEGKGPADLDDVVDKWNAWADKNKNDDYAAWTLTPYYYGPEQEFDFIWLGAGKSAVALGKAQEAFLAENEGLRAAFNEVMACNAHSNFASINFKPAPKGKTPENSVLTFSDCSYKEGGSFSSLSASMADWSKHLEDAGSTTAIFHWYPVYGGGGEAFDFKWLEAHESLATLGADYDSYGNGGGYKTYGRLLSHMIECDSTRVYLAKSRRYVQLR
jgi:hypothetical protein